MVHRPIHQRVRHGAAGKKTRALSFAAKQARQQHFGFRTPLPNKMTDFDYNEASTPSTAGRGAAHVRLPSGRNAEPPAAPKIDRNPVAVEAGSPPQSQCTMGTTVSEMVHRPIHQRVRHGAAGKKTRALSFAGPRKQP